ncbi:CubicO group peptidase (beta-lactamase class C family) [Maribacter spongiicola]|uniref:CubicO group peptidase (Beta-lactamase class C family) n=1 Tax=Maribacter spongiicola TaxID=1206753 RepID=A0A4R7K4P1_9FLAO|nr:serine hydrolase domain-containing protein [Maribacter spongiicola]TDT46165.1 CubicO group peptidase (beta-lactamase class C family) [Maribacter spongiicola]
MIAQKISSLILFSMLIGSTYAQTNDSISNKLTNELEQIAGDGPIVGFSVAIVNENGMLYENGFGFADKKANKKYTKNTLQNIGSISKTFIGMALLKAQELGKLDLDDDINDYLPFEVVHPKFKNTPITIRQLASHTSGIMDPSEYERKGYILKEAENGDAKENGNFLPPNEMMSLGEYLEAILSEDGKWYKKKTFSKYTPGGMFNYSNIGAGLAALLLEQATEESFPEFTQKHIFDPLEMTSTGWSFDAIDFSMHSKLYADADTELAFYKLVNYPDGGLITSAHDLAKYLSEIINGYAGNGTMLSAESFKILFTPQLTDENHKDRSDKEYNDEYNMGVFMGMSSKGQIGHTGSDPSVVTFMFFNEKTKTGKLVLINTELVKKGIEEFIAIWRALIASEDKF